MVTPAQKYFSTQLRRRVATTLLVLIALLGVHLSLDIWFAARVKDAVADIEREFGSLDLKSQELAPIPNAENRAVVVRAACELLDVSREDRDRLTAINLDDDGWAQVDREALAAVIARNQMALDMLTYGAQRPDSNWKLEFRPQLGPDLPRLVPLIDLLRLAHLKAVAQAADGKADAAVETTIEAGLASRSLELERVLIMQLIRMAGDALTAESVHAVLRSSEPSRAALLKLMGTLGAESVRGDMLAAFVCETAILHDQLTLIERGEYQFSEVPTYGRTWWMKLGQPGALLLRPALRWAHIEYLRYQRQILTAAREGTQLDTSMLGSSAMQLFDRDYSGARDNIPYKFASAKRRDAHFALTRTAIALRLYRLDRGAYPPALSDLVPQYLGTTAVDPYSGRELQYQRLNPGFNLSSAGQGSLELPNVGLTVLRWEVPR